MADIFTALYFNVMKHNPAKPKWPERDRLILSNGHIVPVRYACMARAGYFPVKDLMTLRRFGSKLQGHPSYHDMPALESSTGSLGQGVGVAVGMALAAKLDKKKHFVYCVTSDGEHDAGNHWEAVLFAGKNKLQNLTAIVDRNNIQIDGHTEDIMPLEPLAEKYEVFNWHVLHVDGHNIREFIAAVNHAQAVYEKPTVIIAHTIPGKGVSFMENMPEWHGKPPKADEAKQALHELRTLGGKIQGEHE